MKRLILTLLLSAAPLTWGANVPAVTFYVQLIRGSDQDSPPLPTARSIGPKLDRKLHDIFKWKNYWEVKREVVTVKAGSKVRKQISAQRQVEISWPGSKDMMVSIYAQGKLTRKRTQSIDAGFYITGGDNDSSQSWFIVVRRDNPDADQALGARLAEMP
jgi:hypothetical protein